MSGGWNPIPCCSPGIDYQARGAALSRRLLRPAALLCAVALYRFLYCLGTLHRQLQHDALEPSAFGRKRCAVVVLLYRGAAVAPQPESMHAPDAPNCMCC